MKYVCKKHSFTLLEALIAMLLTALLLSTLLYFYRHMSILDVEIEKTTRESFGWRLLENRLAAVLPEVSKRKSGNDAVFFTAPVAMPYGKEGIDSLVFTYNNQVDLDKRLSNQVVGRLFLDPEGRLILATWPKPLAANGYSLDHPKKEVLMEGIEALSFAFFVPPQDESSMSPREAEWKDEWKSTEEKLPAIIKITLQLNKQIHREREAYTVSFPLPNAGQPPVIH